MTAKQTLTLHLRKKGVNSLSADSGKAKSQTTSGPRKISTPKALPIAASTRMVNFWSTFEKEALEATQMGCLGCPLTVISPKTTKSAPERHQKLNRWQAY